LEIAIFEEGGSIWPKISHRRGRPPPTILRMAMWVTISFVLSQFTRLTDGQTDTDNRSTAHHKTAVVKSHR